MCTVPMRGWTEFTSPSWHEEHVRDGVVSGAWHATHPGPPAAPWVVVTLALWQPEEMHEPDVVCEVTLATCGAAMSWQLSQAVEPSLMAATTRGSVEVWQVAQESFTPAIERR